jgi:hypothetical protein
LQLRIFRSDATPPLSLPAAARISPARNFPVRNDPHILLPFPLLTLGRHFALLRSRNMARLYFHRSNSEGVLIDQRGAAINDLAEAREHATRLVRSHLMALNPEDWRDWTMHVSDELDDEIFDISFASVLGKLH